MKLIFEQFAHLQSTMAMKSTICSYQNNMLPDLKYRLAGGGMDSLDCMEGVVNKFISSFSPAY